MLEVYADVACPFAHLSLRRLDEHRRRHDLQPPQLRVRPWPLELVNDMAHDPDQVADEVAALRSGPGADLFAGFDAPAFPTTTLPALVSEAAAYRAGPEIGERFSLAVRDALWEDGLDVADAGVLHQLRVDHGVPNPTDPDATAPRRAWEEGQRRGVRGSPHFFTPDGDFFCPALDIDHGGHDCSVTFNEAGFNRLVAALG
jgi:2-hydroxychromene-2-carboxylate isomerase